MSREVVYEDGTEVPTAVSSHLPFVNENDVVNLIYKDGSQHTSRVMRLGANRHEWFVGTRPLMVAEYAPFKVTVRDKSILTIVNVRQVWESWSPS